MGDITFKYNENDFIDAGIRLIVQQDESGNTDFREEIFDVDTGEWVTQEKTIFTNTGFSLVDSFSANWINYTDENGTQRGGYFTGNFSDFEGDSDLYIVRSLTTGEYHFPVTASAAADPYIFPVDGPPVKLPNAPGRYRMFQDKRTGFFVDVDVDFVPEVHQWILEQQKHGKTRNDWSNPVNDGYYLTKCTINSGTSTSTKIELDLRDAKCFDQEDIPWSDSTTRTGISSTVSQELGGIIHGTYQSRSLRFGGNSVEVRIYDNKQILNALVWTLPSYSPGIIDGLLYKNYRPKLFETSGKFKNTPFIPLPVTGRLLINKSIVGHKEIASSVMKPDLFTAMFQV
jgi:hypothetical protein